MADPSPLPYHQEGAEWYCGFCDYHVQDHDYFIQHMLQRHSVTVAPHDLAAPAWHAAPPTAEPDEAEAPPPEMTTGEGA